MAQPIYANNVAGQLAANIGPSDAALLLGAGQGLLFPAVPAGDWFYATLVHNVTGAIEIVKVTAKAADSLTIVRGQDGTTPGSFTTGSLVEMRLTAQTLRELDFRQEKGDPNGLATLDGTSRLTAAQLPSNVPTLTAGKLDMAVIPDAVATDTELTTKYDKTGGTISGDVALVGRYVQTKGDGRQFALNQWLDLSASGGGSALFGVNCYIEPTDNTFHFSQTHASIGAMGVHLYGFGSDPQFFKVAGATTAGAAFAPTLHTMWHAGNFNPASKLNNAGDTMTGNLIFNGAALGVVAGSDLIIGASFGRAVYLRPNGVADPTNQGVLQASGLLQVVDVQSTSDRRRKRRIQRVQPRNIAAGAKFKGWEMKFDGRPGRGVIAQDVYKVAREHASRGVDGYWTIDKAGVALEQSYSNEERITALEKMVAKQAKLIEKLSKKKG